MKKSIIYIIGILLFSLFCLWKHNIPHQSIIGKYVNNNTDIVMEGPQPIQNGQDTLILYDDFTFESRTWGKGTYTYDSGFWQSEICLRYDAYGGGKASYNSYVKKSTFGKIRILLSMDYDFYFEKIE